MARATNSPATRKRHRRVLERAKGFRGSRSKLFTQATNVVDRAGVQSYIGRRHKKRQMPFVAFVGRGRILVPHARHLRRAERFDILHG